MLNSPHFTSCSEQAGWQSSLEGTAVSDPLLSHHEIEQSVWRELQSIPRVHFYSLTVRRVRDGICLQGVVEAEDSDSAADICDLVRRIAQIETVVNHLLVRECPNPSRVPR